MLKYIKQLLLVLIILLTGCSSEYTELQVLAVIVPKSDTECTIDAKETEWSFFSEGTLDFNLKNAARETGYYVRLKLLNNLPVKKTEGGVSYNNVIVDKIEVQSYFVDSGSEILITKENFYSDITIEPNSLSVVSFTALTPEIYFDVDGLKGYAEEVEDMSSTRLKLKMKVFGHNVGGSNVESNTFEYYVKLCSGCLFPYTSCQGNTVRTSTCGYSQDFPASCVSTEQ